MQDELSKDNNRDWQHLDLTRGPDAWEADTDRTRVLLVAINMPGHYSLPVRILALMANQSPDLSTKYDTRYMEFLNSDDPADIASIIGDQVPKLVGFSVNIWNRDITFSVVERLKKTTPDMKILVGGQEVSHSSVDYLAANPAIDYIIDGEGELPFLQFLATWSSATNGLENPEHVSGLRYRRNSRTVYTGPADIVQSLDDIPSPILAGLVEPRKDYQLGMMLEGARGCPFKCSFCFEGGRKIKVRTASIERLEQEAILMAEQGATYFHIMDPILCNSDPVRLERLTKIFDRLKTINPKIVSSVEAYAHQITAELARFLKRFTIIDIGLQTAHPETARAIHRPWRPERFKGGLANLRKAKAAYNLYLICGLPFETLVTYLNGIRTILAEKPTRIFLNELSVLNGTELRQRAHEYEYVFDKRPPYTLRSSKWMLSPDLKIARALSNRIEKRYNLAARAIHATAPWLPKTAPSYGRRTRIRLAAPCSLQCPGCGAAGRSQTRLPANLDSLLEGVMDTDVDIQIGDQVDMKVLLRLLGQLTLAGAARICLVTPLSLLAEYDLMETFMQRGIWHFSTWMDPNEIDSKPNDLHTGRGVLRQFSKNFAKIGQVTFKPALDVITIVNAHKDPFGIQFMEQVRKLPRTSTTSIVIPEVSAEMLLKNEKKLIELFWSEVETCKWVKLPAVLWASILREYPEKTAIISQFEALGLVSHVPNQPPCFWPAGDYN